MVHKLAKKEQSQCLAILTEQAWSMKDLLHGFWGNISCGTWQLVPSGQDSSILPVQVANHSTGFDSSSPLRCGKTDYRTSFDVQLITYWNVLS